MAQANWKEGQRFTIPRKPAVKCHSLMVAEVGSLVNYFVIGWGHGDRVKSYQVNSIMVK